VVQSQPLASVPLASPVEVMVTVFTLAGGDV